jgi:predicted RNA-binding protein
MGCMCEFKVYLGGERVMEDVIYAEAGDNGVTVRDVVGESRSFKGTVIVEVNVPATRLVLKRT